MPTNAKTKAKKSAERKSGTAEPASSARAGKVVAPNAIDLLEQDHDEVIAYFDEYEDLEDDAEKGELAQKICMALTVHTLIEEEIFYPAARKATKERNYVGVTPKFFRPRAFAERPKN